MFKRQPPCRTVAPEGIAQRRHRVLRAPGNARAQHATEAAARRSRAHKGSPCFVGTHVEDAGSDALEHHTMTQACAAWVRDQLEKAGFGLKIYGENAEVRPHRATFEALGLKEGDVPTPASDTHQEQVAAAPRGAATWIFRGRRVAAAPRLRRGWSVETRRGGAAACDVDGPRRRAQVARLHKAFKKVDKDGSGAIELWEMLDHLDLKRNKFAKRVFAIFDEDGSMEIDFREFVVALWQYCTLGRTQLVMFAFDLYDRDSSGAIDFSEFNGMLKELYGKKYEQNAIALNLLRHINRLNEKRDEEVCDIETFVEFCRSHPAMLSPAFLMQQVMRERILGPAWWDRRADERVRVRGRTVKIHDLMKAHLDETSFHAFMGALQQDDDGVALQANADAHKDFAVDWRSTVEATGTVAQRRRKNGQTDPQSAEVLDKFSSAAAKRRLSSSKEDKPLRVTKGLGDANPALRRSESGIVLGEDPAKANPKPHVRSSVAKTAKVSPVRGPHGDRPSMTSPSGLRRPPR